MKLLLVSTGWKLYIAFAFPFCSFFHCVHFIVTSSGIDKMFENFEPIFEQNAKVNFGPIFVKYVNFVSIFKKSVNFGPIFEKSANFEHFVNGK